MSGTGQVQALVLTVDDKATAALNAAKTAMQGVGQAAGDLGDRLGSVTQSGAQLISRYNDLQVATNSLTSLTKKLADANTNLAYAQETNSGKQDDLAGVVVSLTAKVAAQSDKVAGIQAAYNSAAASAQRLAAAQGDLGAASAAVTAKLETLTTAQKAWNSALGLPEGAATDTAAYGNALDSLRGRFVPLAAAATSLRDGLTQASAAYAKGIIDATELANAQFKLQQAYQGTVQAATAANAAQAALGVGQTAAQQAALDRTAQQNAATAAATQNQANINQNLGVNTTGASSGANTAESFTAAAAAADQERAAIDKLYASSKAYSDELDAIAAAQAKGIINTQQATVLQQQSTDAFSKANQPLKDVEGSMVKTTASAGETRFALQQLSVQTVQFGSALASGQNPLIAFVQQAHQVGDVAISSGTGLGIFKSAAQAIGSFLTGPVGLTIGLAAVAAGLIYMGVSADEAQGKLLALQNTMRATRTDYDAAAQAAQNAAKDFAAANPSVSGKDATGAATTLASTPGLVTSSANMQALLTQANNLAAVMGTTLPEAAKELQKALEDPAAEADALAKQHFPGFTQALVDTITQMEKVGDRGGALKLTLDTINQTTQGAAANGITPLAQALDNLKSKFDGVAGSSTNFFGDLSNALGSAITTGINTLANLIGDLQAMQTNQGDTIFGVKVPAVGTLRSQAAPGISAALAAGGTAAAENNGSIASAAGIQSLLNTIATLPGITASAQQLNALQSQEGEIRNGQWVNVPGGGQGPLQVTKTTFAGMVSQPDQFPQLASAIASNGGKADINNVNQNAVAGSELFSQLLSANNGDVWDATVAYHYGQSVLNQIKAGGNPAAVAKDQGAGLSEADRVAALSGQGSGPGRNTSSPAGVSNNGLVDYSGVQTDSDRSLTDSINTIEKTKADLQTQLDAANRALSADIPGSASYTADAAAVRTLQAQYDNTKTSLQQLTEQQKQAQIAAGQYGGAAQAINAAIVAADAAERSYGGNLDVGKNRTEAIASATAILNAQFGVTVKGLDDNIASTSAMADAYLKVGGPLIDFTAHQQALKDALSTADPATNPQGYANQVAILTQKYIEVDGAQQKWAADQQIQTNSNTIQQLQLQAAAVGENTDQLTKQLDVLKEQQDLKAKGLDGTAQGDTLIEQVKEMDDLTASTKRQNDALTTFGDLATQSFQTLGTSITNAFIQGSSAGVNFNTVMQGILTQIIETVAEMAILNPLLNDITGGDRSTLADLFSVGSSAAGGSVGSTGMAIVGLAGAAAGTSGAGGFDASPSTGTGAGGSTSALSTVSGLGSTASSIYSLGKGLYSGLTGGGFTTGIPFIDGLLSTSTGIGGTTAAAAGEGAAQAGTGFVAAQGGAASTLGAGTTGASLVGGASVGDLLGGAGAGFALGSLLNQYVFKGNQTNGEIGAGAGAAVGSVAGAAAAGAFTLGIAAPVGALIGGLLGGVIGGGGGGMIGPQLPNYGYEVTEGATSNGLLGILKSGGEGDPGGQAAQALAKQVSAYNDSFNQILAQAGISVSGSTILGSNNYSKNGKGDAASGNAGKETTDLNSIFANLSFSSSNSILNSALTNPLTKPQNITQLSAISDAFADLAKNMGTLLNPLTGTNDAIGSYGTSLQNLNTNYATAISEAKTLGMSTQSLTDAQSKAQAALKATADAQVQSSLGGFQVRDLTALGDSNGAATLQLQLQAQAETASFSASLIALYGENFKSTSDYASDMALLSKTQQDEATALANSQAQAAAAAAAQVQAAFQQAEDTARSSITGIYESFTSYIKSLEISTSSPLSPVKQLAAARAAFNADAAAAAAGNSTAFGQLQGDATSLLTASRAVNGSGAGYVADFNAVIAAGGVASGAAGDALTIDAMNVISQTQTDTMVSAIQALQAEMSKITLELQQQNAR